MRRLFSCLLSSLLWVACSAQSTQNFEDFRNRIMNDFKTDREQKYSDYESFRSKINADYAKFLAEMWRDCEMSAPLKKPVEATPVPPVIYEENQNRAPVEIPTTPVSPVVPDKQPSPVSPVEENKRPSGSKLVVEYYGIKPSVRAPIYNPILTTLNNNSIAKAWTNLSQGAYENTAFDCLQIREEYKLCDWAYLQFVNTFSKKYCGNEKDATLLSAWILCQSGYKIRLALSSKLHLLFACRHIIFGWGYYVVNGERFFPLDNVKGSIKICDAQFPGEESISLFIDKEISLGDDATPCKQIKSERYPGMVVTPAVNKYLLDFYNSYPVSVIDDNPYTKWVMYANAPFNTTSYESIRSSLRRAIEGLSQLEAVERLLNLVQTGFEYKYDEEVWGYDRAFFAEETLYYPYCDCEDRAILFSQLVRNLVGLDVVLVYYPNHLATAVKFPTDVTGDAITFKGKRYIVCDPTYIGAKVGHQMPGLDYSQTKVILLNE